MFAEKKDKRRAERDSCDYSKYNAIRVSINTMKDKYINLLLIFLESCTYRAKYYIQRYNFQGNQSVLPPKSHFLHKNEAVATLVELFAIVPSFSYFEVAVQFLFDLPYFL